MKIRNIVPAAVLMTAGLAALPGAAFAAEGVVFSAQTGASVPVHPGETVPVPLGVANVGDQDAAGIVINIRVVNDVELPTTFSNCRYYIDSNVEGAYCRFDTTITPEKVYRVDGFRVSTTAAATTVTPVIFQLLTLETAEKLGGIDALAADAAGQGNPVVTGTGAATTLAVSDLTLQRENATVGFASLTLILPSAPASASSPATASASASASASTTATAATTSGEDGGGLPVTGSDTTTIVGAGTGILALGLIGIVLARRRRTRFVA
ncbi:LPXTG cell wall anchor domain-containing protein [Actinoplanes sp. NPDC051851]|uniref:LPXTG cell wall anchor domain-containing protein n=1 Tax=Actinoplanes sp. NPDC051851 TaxID=3154753 RepID=UPI0034413733